MSSVADVRSRQAAGPHPGGQKERALPLLLQLNQSASRANATIDEIVQSALDVLDQLIAPDRAAVLLFDESGKMRFRAWRKVSASYRRAVDGHSPWSADAVDPQPICVGDVRNDDALAPFRDVILTEGICALAFIPLSSGGKLVGKFMLYYDAARTFSEDEVALAQAIGSHVAFVVARKHAELSLALYQNAFASSTAATAVIDLQGRFVARNGAYKVLSGYSDEDLEGKTPAFLVGEEKFAQVHEALTTIGTCQTEARLRTADGRLLDIEVNAFAIRDDDGVPRFFIGTHRDVTQSLQIERRVRLLAQAGDILRGREADASLGYLARVVTDTFADWCVVDLAQEDGSVRRAAASIRDQRLQPSLDALVREYPVVAGSRQPAAVALESGTVVFNPSVSAEFLRSTCRDERHVQLVEALSPRSIIAVPIRGRKAPLGVLTCVWSESGRAYTQDDVDCVEELAARVSVTLENLRLTRELSAAVSARDEFLSIASHELRTPLTSLHLQLGTLARESRATESAGTAQKRMEAALRQIRRLTRLVDDLLEVSRISAGKVTLELERCDVVELANETARRFESDFVNAGCAFALRATAPVIVPVDRLRLDLVVSNLLSNACKYGAGKPIELDVERDGDLCRLTVRDHGIGIAAADLSRVFDRFERVVSSRNFSGFGLGLWISRQIVEAHGGTIRVKSRQGEGATFTVEVPGAIPAA